MTDHSPLMTDHLRLAMPPPDERPVGSRSMRSLDRERSPTP